MSLRFRLLINFEVTPISISNTRRFHFEFTFLIHFNVTDNISQEDKRNNLSQAKIKDTAQTEVSFRPCMTRQAPRARTHERNETISRSQGGMARTLSPQSPMFLDFAYLGGFQLNTLWGGQSLPMAPPSQRQRINEQKQNKSSNNNNESSNNKHTTTRNKTHKSRKMLFSCLF